uniref:Uncharacterized protein n=1 Tax=Rhizophora mucronata TaxID=61149 RepID=A0A2P2P3S7_RHIMU
MVSISFAGNQRQRRQAISQEELLCPSQWQKTLRLGMLKIQLSWHGSSTPWSPRLAGHTFFTRLPKKFGRQYKRSTQT